MYDKEATFGQSEAPDPDQPIEILPTDPDARAAARLLLLLLLPLLVGYYMYLLSNLKGAPTLPLT